MIRVLIVSDIYLYLEGISMIINNHESIEVVGTCTSAQEAFDAVIKLSPKVVLLDMAMQNGLATVEWMKRIAPTVLILVLGVKESPEEVIACAKVGASNYITRRNSGSDLVQTIMDTVRGEMRCSPAIAGSLFRQVGVLHTSGGGVDYGYNLTNRELEVARLIDKGLSNKEIAAHLFIEVSTVKNHVHNLIEKLNVRRRGQVVSHIRPLLAQFSARNSGMNQKN